MIERIKRLFDDTEENENESDKLYNVLYEVAWEETVEKEYVDVTATLVWSGGESKTITYTESYSDQHLDEYMELKENGDVERCIEIRESPAYVEEQERETWTRERTKRKTAWVSDVPPNVEWTGETKEVVWS